MLRSPRHQQLLPVREESDDCPHFYIMNYARHCRDMTYNLVTSNFPRFFVVSGISRPAYTHDCVFDKIADDSDVRLNSWNGEGDLVISYDSLSSSRALDLRPRALALSMAVARRRLRRARRKFFLGMFLSSVRSRLT